MSDSVVSNPDNLHLVPSGVPQISGGAMLRQAREAAGLHIAALAVSLKVPVKKLEALETDRLDQLPDIVFVRALAASVCRVLKIDPAPILDQFPQTIGPRLKTDETGINTPFRATGQSSSFVLREQLTKPFSLAVLVLLIGALVLVFVPFSRKSTLVKSGDTVSPQASDTPSTLAANALVTTSNTESAQQAPSAVISNVDLTAPSVDSRPIEPLLSGAQGAQVAVLPVVVNESKAVVTFKAHGVSWVEVVDARGAVQLRKTMVEGETLEASGALPLAVVVGRADTIDVQVRGQSMDLKQLAKDNVARFEVK